MAKLFQFDKHLLGENTPGIVGVDEAGRGCFAGPVVAGAIWVHRSFYQNSTPIKRSKFINDSKQISAETREEIFALIEHWERKGELVFSMGEASVREIETLNILGASRLAMHRAIEGILKKIPSGSPCPFATAGADDTPLFDRGTAFPKMLIDGRPLTPFAWKHKAIVKGDATSLAIALASITAKVSRDQRMSALAEEYPKYGFREHKGYGTPVHIAAIRKHGISPLHRPSFLKKLAISSPTPIPGLKNLSPDRDENPAQSEFSF